MRRVWVLVACGLLLAACGGGGGAGDGGTPDGGVRGTSGKDGGRTGECDVEAQDCAEGQSCVPVAPEDGGTVAEPRCRAGECNVVTQDCPEGQRCTYAAGDGGPGGRRCEPLSPQPRADGEDCGGTLGECAEGLFCAGDTPTDGGAPARYTCRRFCGSDGDCGASQLCLATDLAVDTPERPLLCTTVAFCEPLLQDCPASEGCYFTGSRSICLPAGGQPVGASCRASTDCARGSGCFERPSGRTCLALCSVTPGGEPSCTIGSCTLVQGASFGACVP